MERITRAIDTIVRQVLSDAISQEELDAVIACSEEILLDAEELDDIDASSDEELLQDVIATACSGFNVNDHAQERLVLELEAAAVLDDIRNLHSKQTISIKVNDVCPVYLAEVGFQPARVEAIDTVDGELIATMQLLDFNMSVREPLSELATFADAEDDDIEGTCELCERQVALTRHHLIPRTTHSKYLKTFTKAQLNTVAMLCRPCHSAVHRLFTNAELAETYNTIEVLKQQPRVQKWIAYAKSLRKMSRQEHEGRLSNDRMRKDRARLKNAS
eukprot:TRINITY_DN12546_c0_g1_i1.p1 TRINITY_DN12546_c0_g1~~TRINITY_DN12546_c0_g1_i1.p1  ORF type:complete len:274 (+),score=58.86 TRINITY_DN12546_c0_g1_i1:1451-2272(+)